MSLKQKLHQILALISLVFIIESSAYASSTFTMNIENITDQNIVAFTSWFSVDESFTFRDFSFGDSVPTVGTFKWLAVKGERPDSIVQDAERGLVYKVDALDYDNAFNPSGEFYPLLNGTLFTFTYEGTLNALTDVLILRDRNNDNLIETGNFVIKDFSATGGTLAPVPVPSTLLLLGGGIFALVGGTRRKNRG